MKGRVRRPVVLALVGIAALGQWGCALMTRGRPALEEARERLSVVAVNRASDTPKASLRTPTSGRGGAAAKGAGTGLVAGAQPGVAILSGISHCKGGGTIGAVICGTVALVGVGVAAAGGTIGALTGALYEAANTETPSEAVGETLKSAAQGLNLQHALLESILQAGPRQTRLMFVPVEAAGDVRTTAAETVLDVTLRTIRLTREGPGANPPVTLVATARARLIRAADRQELYRHAVSHRSETRPYEEWAAEDGRHLKEALITATAEMAKEIIDVFFVRSEPPPVTVMPERSQPFLAAASGQYQQLPQSWTPARNTADAAKQYACQRRHLTGFADWRDRLPEYRACLAQP